MTARIAAVKTSWIAITGTILLSWVGAAVWGVGNWAVGGGEHVETLSEVLHEYSIGVVIWLMTYGLFFWIPFALTIVLLDLCLFGKSGRNLRLSLVVESGVTALPLIFLAGRYSNAIIILPVVALLIAQFLREKPIRTMLAPVFTAEAETAKQS
jgi:hypothetical protein